MLLPTFIIHLDNEAPDRSLSNLFMMRLKTVTRTNRNHKTTCASACATVSIDTHGMNNLCCGQTDPDLNYGGKEN